MKILERKNILILGFTLLVVMLGYGMIQPILPFLITSLGAGGRDLGMLTSVYAAMQLVFAPIWGSLSDRVGRKPILMVGVLGYAAAMFVFGLTTRIWMLYLARTFSGVLSSAALPTAMAYISDNLPEKERGGAMGQLGAAVGLGVVLGPMLGGLLSTDSLSLPFFIGSGLALVALLLVHLLLPESHGAPAQTNSAAKPGNFWQWGALKQILSGPTGVLMLLILILSFGMTNFQGIVGLYVVDKFAFDTRQVGAIWMVIGAVMILGQGVLTGPLTKRLGEVTVIRLGLFIGAAGFGSLLLANGFGLFLLATGIFTLAVALIGPAMNSYLSAFGGVHQGALMGLNTAFASMGRVIGPLWAGFIFDVNIAFPFISGMVTLFLGSVFSLAGLKKRATTNPSVLQAKDKMDTKTGLP